MRRGKAKVRLSNSVTEIDADGGTDVVVKKAGKRGRPKVMEKDPLALPKKRSSSSPASPKKSRGSPTKAKAKPKGKAKAAVLTKAAKKQPAEPEEYEVEQIVGHRAVGVDMSYRIRWKGWGPKDDTWQLESELSCDKLLREYKEQIRTAAEKAPATPKKAAKSSPSKKLKVSKATKASKAAVAGTPKRGRTSTKAASAASPLKGVAKGRVTKKPKEKKVALTKAGKPMKKRGPKSKAEMEADGEWEVEEIVAVRTTEKGKEEFLVKWKGYASEENTWEPLKNVKKCKAALAKFRSELNGETTAAAADDTIREGEDTNAAGDNADDKKDEEEEEEEEQDAEKENGTETEEATDNGDAKEDEEENSN